MAHIIGTVARTKLRINFEFCSQNDLKNFIGVRAELLFLRAIEHEVKNRIIGYVLMISRLRLRVAPFRDLCCDVL